MTGSAISVKIDLLCAKNKLVIDKTRQTKLLMMTIGEKKTKTAAIPPKNLNL